MSGSQLGRREGGDAVPLAEGAKPSLVHPAAPGGEGFASPLLEQCATDRPELPQELSDERRASVIRMALRRFIHDAYALANESGQDRAGRFFGPGATAAFLRDAKDAEAIYSALDSA